MANKSTAITDPDYQARLEEAYQKLVESLDERKNRVFDPTWMAAAQAFATPSRTGSAFEAIGRVAGAVGKSQEEEAKKEFELNKAKFDINKELLTISQQRKMQEMGMAALGGEQPTQPTPPAAGALPGQPPAEGGALTSAVGAAPVPGIKQTPLELEPQGNLPPMQPIKTAGVPQPELVTKPVPPPSEPPPPLAGALPAPAVTSPGLMGLTKDGQKIAQLALSQGVPIADAFKKGADYDTTIANRINSAEKLKIEQGTLAQGNIRTLQDGTVIDMSSGKPEVIHNAGSKEINIGGEPFLSDPVITSRYLGALSKNNVQESERLARLITKNRFGSPLSQAQEPAAVTAPAAQGTTTESKPAPVGESVRERTERLAREDAERASKLKIQETVKIDQLKAEQKRQEELVSRMDAIKTQKNDTKTLIEIFNKKDVQKVLGPTAKPGVKAAIGELVSGGLNVGGYSVAIANFDKAIVNMGATQEVIDQLNVAGSLLSKAELLNARTYLKGEGTVTNMERGIVKDINGLAYKDPANALLFKSQLAYAQSNMNERYIKTFQSWRDKNPDGTIEQFNRTKAYNTIESDYHDELKKINKTIGLGTKPTEAPKKESGLTAARNKINSLLQ
jgi:hypothetical protein